MEFGGTDQSPLDGSPPPYPRRTSDWRRHYSPIQQRELGSWAAHLVDRAHADPGSLLLAATHTLYPSRFGDWETVACWRPSRARGAAHDRLWRAARQFKIRFDRDRLNHPERKRGERSVCLAFIDDPKGEVRSPSGQATGATSSYDDPGSGGICRRYQTGTGPIAAIDSLVANARSLWRRCPGADDLKVDLLPDDLEEVGGWIGYSAKYAWRLRRRGAEELQWLYLS
jgi:hypothetical protein